MVGVESRVETLDKKVDKNQETLFQAIKESQEDTIDVLSGLIYTVHDAYEKRFGKIEDQPETLSSKN